MQHFCYAFLSCRVEIDTEKKVLANGRDKISNRAIALGKPTCYIYVKQMLMELVVTSSATKRAVHAQER
jgi:hypothetical protein